MITLETWKARIDAFIEEENADAGRSVPVYRIYCQDDSDRSGGGIYNETVTVDTIGRFVRALGDSNPLYSDPRYTQTVPGGPACIPAPPLAECCICSTFIGGRMPRLRGVRVFDAGTKWERFLPILAGDTFTARTTRLGIREITRAQTEEPAARLLVRSHAIDLYNQRREHVSRLTARSILRFAVPGARPADTAGQQAGNGRPHYTEEELEEVYASLDAQLAGTFRRGGLPRYYEDVAVGEQLPAQMVGPYDESDGQALMAAIGVSNAFATKWGTIRRSVRSGKGHGILDPVTGAYRLPIDRHNSDEIARTQGLPRALVSGIHSQALLAKSVSDWMGDAGFLRSLDCRCLKPLYYGDLSVQRGVVTDKYVQDGRCLVVLQMEAVRQDGVVHTDAAAVVELPGGRQAPAGDLRHKPLYAGQEKKDGF